MTTLTFLIGFEKQRVVTLMGPQTFLVPKITEWYLFFTSTLQFGPKHG